jgi:hypothetical protein
MSARDIFGIALVLVTWAFLHWAFVLNNPNKTLLRCLRRAKAGGFEKAFMDRITTSAVIGESSSQIIERWSAKDMRNAFSKAKADYESNTSEEF